MEDILVLEWVGVRWRREEVYSAFLIDIESADACRKLEKQFQGGVLLEKEALMLC